MPCWVIISDRIIVGIRISIPGLRSLLLRNHRIRLGGPAEGGVIPAGVVEHQAEALGGAAGGGVVHVGVLSRVGVGGGLVSRRGGRAGGPRGADFAPGLVAQFQHLCAVGVRGERGAAQVVTEQVFHGHVLGDGVFAHGHAGRACQVVLGDLVAVLDLVMRAHACPATDGSVEGKRVVVKSK